MDGTTDLFWPSMLFTLFAILVAAVFLGRNKIHAPSKCSHQTSAVVEERAGPDHGASSQYHEKLHNETSQQDVKPQSNEKSRKANDETVKHMKDSNSDNESDSPVYSSTGWEEDSSESGIRNALRDYVQSPDAETKPLKYMAGMLRTCQLEKMMTKEELEEEQRVQREQLAAIFQLLKDKQDTFVLWMNLSEQFHSKTVIISALILSRIKANLHKSEKPIFPTEREVNITPIPILYKKNFTKLPVWDFEDVYLRNNEAKRQTCPKSLQNTEDSKFKESVLPDIQLWLYKGLLNITEWNRLAHFNNPFGFMEYKYNEVKAAVDLIPKPSIFLPVPESSKDGCIRCAVVGSGGILNNSKMGKEIDSHEYVFRVNGAVTQGYEEDVGNKTSVYVHTSFSMYANILTLKQYGFDNIPQDKDIKYVMIPEGLRDFEWIQGLLQGKEAKGSFKGVRPLKYFNGNFNESRFFVLHPDFLRYIRNRFMLSKQVQAQSWAMYRPTNGAFALFLAIHTCDIVDAYGFITEDHHKYSNYYYERAVEIPHKEKKVEHKLYINLIGSRVYQCKLTDSLQRVEEPDPTNSFAVTDEGANTTVSPDSLGTQSATPVPVMDKHNFTALPQWKSDNMYRLDPQFKQSQCTASLRNSSSPVFKEKSIPNIQLFLQSDHLNLSEWNRLYHFNNPFGYMGLNYTAIKAAVDTIPKLASTQLLQVPTRAKDGCIRCAVVGTSGILNGSRLGKEIDSSDYVFRVNAAIIEGHEEDVGKRTSVYVHTAHSLIQSLMLLKKRGFKHIPNDKDVKYVLIPEGPRDYNFLESLMKNRRIPSGAYRGHTPRRYYSGHFNESSYYILHPDFLRYVRNNFLRSKQLKARRWWLVRPTNGAFTLLLAMHTCDIVRAYGFSTTDYQKYSNYYYDTKRTKLVLYANHDYRLEMKTWKKFHDDKVIWMYLGKSDV
ncbi:hypothetical protein Q8A67_020599 [Cirrhinus molitorella]|uniref:alpha-N-acetylgalactosaminide alpha-2,6-sialyltransferase n=1 Tax=Cirrhinus molitorella TaxID=172907 RepID=A0AA88P5I1_9TELE|nr:hypothetical protein Q8A67_020599 [Cirrhinus molitorella]